MTLNDGFNPQSIEIAFLRAYDVVSGALAWRTWVGRCSLTVIRGLNPKT